MFREVVRSRTSSPYKKQRDVGIPLRSLSHLHQSRDGDRTRRCAHLPNIRDPAIESRAVKRRVGSSTTSTADPNVDKSSPAGDADVSDMLETNLLSSPSACFKLVYLETVSSLSLEKQRESIFDLLKKGVVLVAETIQNSSAVAPFSAADLEAEEAVAKEDEAEEDATDEVVADVTNQAGGVAESAADQAEA
ncbi:hypothetical protein L3X38_017493 [Prunus dulcis]|uniref:Uncharacterized protein n=1 Tax=Prunus dulcis TaxID=3755 RepID=A0AAD4W9Y2_PRUDU|nr:hypothetical protein L3X38_017493 [Prunus dulcis]